MKFRNTPAINSQRPEALVKMSSDALMASDGRVAFETHLMNSLSIQIGIRSHVSLRAMRNSDDGAMQFRNRYVKTADS